MAKYPHHHPQEVAAHEAAHVVVGLFCGLRLIHVVIATPGNATAGFALFAAGGSDLAYAIQYAAGVVWDEMTNAGYSAGDAHLCRKHVNFKADVNVCKRIAKEILITRKAAHQLITTALLESDDHKLTGADVRRLIKGEK